MRHRRAHPFVSKTFHSNRSSGSFPSDPLFDPPPTPRRRVDESETKKNRSSFPPSHRARAAVGFARRAASIHRNRHRGSTTRPILNCTGTRSNARIEERRTDGRMRGWKTKNTKKIKRTNEQRTSSRRRPRDVSRTSIESVDSDATSRGNRAGKRTNNDATIDRSIG